MTIYTVIGDPHAKPTNLDKINKLFDIVEELGNPVIWLGDLLDTKEVVRGKCLNTYMRRFQNSKLQHCVLVGNHDWFNLECKEHSLEPLKVLKNVQVIDQITLASKTVEFLPYTHNQEQLKGWLSSCQGKIVFCHADIIGCDFGNGLISTEGSELEDFKGVKKVVSGHYHKFQEVGNITYLGTPFSHSFGETDQEKFIGIFDTATCELELLETPFPKHITQTIDCSQHPKHKVLDTENIVRVILKGTQEEIDKFNKVDGYKYIEQPTSAQKQTAIAETSTPQVQFSKWAKDIKGYSDEILELGLEVLSDV